MYRIAIIILYILPLMPIWHFDYLPIQDYPRHLAGIKVLRGYENSFLQQNFSSGFFKGFSPIPNITFELFATRVCSSCDINTSGKLFISGYVILFILSLYLLSREMKTRYADTLLMALPLAYSTYLYMGFLNFIFSIPLFLTAIWCYSSAKRERRYFVLLGIVSATLYISHLFSFASLLVFFVIDLAISPIRQGKRFIFLTFASVSVPLFFSVNYLLLSAGGSSYYHPDVISYKILMLASPFLFFPLGVGIAMFLCYIYALLFTFRGSPVINRVFLTAAISYLLLYFALPFGGIEGNFIDMRAIAFGMAVLPFSVNLEGNRYKRAVFAFITLLAIINTSATWFSFSRFNKDMSTALTCLRQVKDESRLLPVAFERQGPFGQYFLGKPYLFAWGYAFLEKDFMTPYFSSKVHHIVKYKTEQYIPPDGWYSKGTSPAWEGLKKHYDYVAIFGRDASIMDKIGRIGTEMCGDGLVALYKVNK